MRIVVTGAAGFIGSHVVARILDGALGPFQNLVLLDTEPSAIQRPNVETVVGSFADPVIRERAISGGVDLLFHLASIPGGAAEAEYDRGRRVNLEGTLELIDAIAHKNHPPRIVYTSSIAALGGGTGPVTSETPLRPHGSYGTHKAMVELHVADLSRRGMVDGRSLRPSGIVSRPPARYAGFATAWMSDIFRKLSRGQDFGVPSTPDALIWLESVGAVADDIIHAARMPIDNLTPHRAWTLPATVNRLGDLADTILAESGQTARVTFAASGFSQSPLDSSDALAAGFRGDGGVVNLVRAVLRQLETEA